MRTDEQRPDATIEGDVSREGAGAPQSRLHGHYDKGLAFGRLIYKIRWLIVLIWLAALAASVPFAARVSSVLTGGGHTFQNSESVHASNLMSSALNLPRSQILVVFQSTTTPVSDPAYQQELNAFTSSAANFSGVTNVAAPVTGNDGMTALVVVSFNRSADTVEHQLTAFRKLLPSASDSPARVYLTGDPALYAAFTTITQQDMGRAEATALPLALLVLLIVFGTIVSAMMPLVLAGVAVPVALAIIYAIALHTQTSVFVTSIASIVGLGISIDYSLFMTRRFRDEMASGKSVADAVAWTVATAGEAILFSGLTVMIGFIGLMLIGVQLMASLGIGGAVVVGIAVLAALTMLPALLSILGHRVNALRLPIIGKLVARHTSEGESRGLWHAWAMGVMKRPVLIILVVTAILIGLGWPIFSLNIGTTSASSLPAGAEARQGLDILAQQFPSDHQDPIMLVVQSPDGSSMLTATNLARVNDLTEWVYEQAHITSVTSLTALPSNGMPPLSVAQLTKLYTSGYYTQVPGIARFVSATTNGDTTVITASSNTKLDSAAGKALIDNLRAGDTAAGHGLKVYVGGFQATSLDFNRYLYGSFPRAILFILIATFLLLLLMFRSLLLPLKAILMNVLSVSAAYGVLVFVFQWGNFQNFLGFTSDGFIDGTIPILLFCLLFGLSMDYEVFLLSRIREEWLRTGNNRAAVARGLEKTGGVITNAALLFVIVTGAFTFTTIIITKETGLGMTVAVLVDATIIRSLLVPATMRLLGRWNWWLPGRPLPVERAV